MSFDVFLNNPKSYLNHHRMLLSQPTMSTLVPACLTQAAGVANGAAGNTVQYTHTNNLQFIAEYAGVGGKGKLDVVKGQLRLAEKRLTAWRPTPGGANAGLRFLPFIGTDVTFMELDGAATFVLTGPLQGCTIGAVNHNGTYYLFHANVSGTGGVDNANRLTKRTQITNAGTTVGVPVGANYRYCQYGPGQNYNGWGFVWGRQRPGGGWKFYCHWIVPANPGGFLPTSSGVHNTKWADI